MCTRVDFAPEPWEADFFLEDVCAFFIRTCHDKLGRLPAWHPVVRNRGRNLSLTLCQGLSLAKSILGRPPGVARAGWRLGRLHTASEMPSDSEELCRDSQSSTRTCAWERRGFPLSPPESSGLSTCWCLSLGKPQCTCSQRASQKAWPHRLPAAPQCEKPGRPAGLSWGSLTRAPSGHRWNLCEDAWEGVILRSP